jgi:hypothetical protein
VKIKTVRIGDLVSLVPRLGILALQIVHYAIPPTLHIDTHQIPANRVRLGET